MKNFKLVLVALSALFVASPAWAGNKQKNNSSGGNQMRTMNAALQQKHTSQSRSSRGVLQNSRSRSSSSRGNQKHRRRHS